MVARIGDSRPKSVTKATTQPPARKPAKAETAAPAATKRGWGPSGAGKAGRVGSAQTQATKLKLISAKLTEFPSAPKLVTPQGFEAKTADDNRVETLPLAGGKTAKLEWSSQSLSVTGPDGKTVELAGKDEQGFAQYKADFTDNFKDLKPEDMEYLQTDWDASRSFGGVGAAGKMMSVSETESDYTGGAHPNYGSQLNTYDLRTGQKQTLDKLLTPEQFKGICDAITTSLPKLKGEDGIDGQTFQPYQDMKKMVAENFALSTDSKGKTQITVAWQSGVHALGDTAATFVFAAPDDAKFKAAIGAD